MLPQVRELRSELLSLRPPVLIVPHSQADVDAVASAMGVHSFLRHRGISAVLLFPSLSAPAANLLKDLAVDYATDLDVAGRDVVVVDTSSSSMLPVDVFPASRVLVIDHHRGGDLRGWIFNTPSLSEVVAQLLIFDGIRDEKAYLALAAGIYSDTAGLLAADSGSLRVLSEIMAIIDVSVSDIARILDVRPSVSERIARLKALRRMKIHRFGDFVVVTSSAGAHEGSAAWTLILAGADLAFVAGKGRIIGRASDDFLIRAGFDLTDVFSTVSERLGGTWGGHPAAAGIHVSDSESALETVLAVVEELMRRNGFKFVRRDY